MLLENPPLHWVADLGEGDFFRLLGFYIARVCEAHFCSVNLCCQSAAGQGKKKKRADAPREIKKREENECGGAGQKEKGRKYPGDENERILYTGERVW